MTATLNSWKINKMNKNDIWKIFNKTFKGHKNSMTPRVREYGFCKNESLVYELSSGKGIFTPVIFGVTILKTDGSKTDLSQCFDSENEALAYARGL